MNRAFLTAKWRNLVMLNYEVDPPLLAGLVPRGTELDTWSGRTFVSLVAFLFDRTRVLGIPIPFHRTFEEVNLRFYVRRTVQGETRRAVTFVRELVPRQLVARTARFAYNEPYTAVAMSHRYGSLREDWIPSLVEYAWQIDNAWNCVRVTPVGSGSVASPQSKEEFVTEHYWGYTRQRDGSTVEYQVMHPRWRVWSVRDVEVTGNLRATYGPAFGEVLSSPPSSAFFADGSAVTVGRPTRLITHA